MRSLLRASIIILLCHLSGAGWVKAAEVTNLTSRYSGEQYFFEYDLVGSQGEKDACIEVSLTVNDQKYLSNGMSLSGDFGSSVPLGTGRRIVWKCLDDFPQGLTSTFKLIVDAAPKCKLPNEGVNPSEGVVQSHFAVNRQTVVDTRKNLMWTRNAGIFKHPVTYADSHNLIEKLNRERYAGYGDWRMPTREEFEALVTDGKDAGWGKQFARYIADFLVTCGFKNVQPGYYWTSTLSEAPENRVFVANGWNGVVRPLEKTNYYVVWPVRSSR